MKERSYDYVVGADGISSQTRSMLFPDAPKPAYTGQMSLRWMAPGPPVEPEGWYVGPVGRMGFYYLPQGYNYVAAVIFRPEWVRMSKEEVHALFTQLLDSYTAPAIVELRKRLTPEADVFCRPFEWILLEQPWFRGRTLLIGDAAHATSAHLEWAAVWRWRMPSCWPDALPKPLRSKKHSNLSCHVDSRGYAL